MWIDNRLTDEDLARAHAIGPPQALQLAGGFTALLEAVELLSEEIIIPVFQTRQPWNARQTAVAGLFYRLVGFCKSAIALNHVVHQQALTASARSSLELLIDLKLLHAGCVPDDVTRFFAFADYQRLKAARRAVRFLSEHPRLDQLGSRALAHRAFIDAQADRIDAQAKRLWPRPDGRHPKPVHWTGEDLLQRVARLDIETQQLVIDGYDLRNFAVHTGIAGIANLDRSAFEIMCAQAVERIGKCLLQALPIVGLEMEVHDVVDTYDEILRDFDDLPVWAMADQILRGAGEPQRCFLRAGPWTGSDRA